MSVLALVGTLLECVELHQKQPHKHNRQIHKCNPLNGDKRKLSQSPHIVKEFRLFDKVECLGKKGFVMGRHHY